jgi:hypothetical protein
MAYRDVVMDSDEYDVRRGADGWRGANASVAGKACDNNTVRTNTDMGRTGLIRTQQLMFASPVAMAVYAVRSSDLRPGSREICLRRASKAGRGSASWQEL